MADENGSATLILVRHGQARAQDGVYNRETPLSRLGRKQAAATAYRIANDSVPAAVYTSPIVRAVATADVVCQRLGLTAIQDPRLAEFELPSTSLESAQQRPDLLIWRSDQRGVAHGETLADFCARVGASCEELVRRHLDERVVVVAHSGTIEAAIRWSVGLMPPAPWQHELDIPNGSITELEFWPNGRVQGGAPWYARLGCIGDARHLDDMISEL